MTCCFPTSESDLSGLHDIYVYRIHTEGQRSNAMAGNHPFMQYGMDQRQMEWSQMSQNNQMNLNYTRNPAPLPYGQSTNTQPTGHRTFSRAQLETARLFEDAMLEVRNLTYNNASMQQMDNHYVKRRKFQQYLAKLCMGNVIYSYVSSREFLLNFDSPATLQAVQRVTGMDAATLKYALSVSLQSNTQRNRHVQMNQPVSQGSQFVDFQHNQSAQNVGDFTQFQVQGTNNTLHNGATRSYNALNSMASLTMQSQRAVNAFTQESVIESMSKYIHPQNERVSAPQQQPQLTHFNNQQQPQLTHFNNQQQSQLSHSNIQQAPQRTPPNNQQQSRWYSMPTERYESGRVVQKTERQSPQQPIPQSGGHGGPFRESPQQLNPQQSFPQPRNIVTSPPYQALSASLLPVHPDGQSGTGNTSSLQLLNQTVSQIQPRSNSAGCNSRPSEIKSAYHQTHNAGQIQPRSNSAECKSNRGKSLVNNETTVERSVVCSPNSNEVNQGTPQIQNRPGSSNSMSTNGKGEQTGNSVFSGQKERETVTPPDSKEHLREMLKQLNATSEHVPSQLPQERETRNSSIESQHRIATPDAIVAQTSESVEEQTENSDILELFSMPVITDDVEPAKDVPQKCIPNRRDVLKSFDDMNVLSPFTSDVVSDSVDNWLSGSRRSELLDQLGLKSQKEKHNKIHRKTSVECVSSDSRGPNSGNVRTSESDSKETECTKSTEGKNVPQTNTHTDNSVCNEKHDSANADKESQGGLGEYDPPLPVIKLKKREDRISPVKKTGGVTNIQERRKSSDSLTTSKGNREPLFSVLDNMLTRSSDCSNSGAGKNTDCSQEESSTVSARQKVYSNWCGKYNDNEKGQHYSSKLHARRKSCPDQKGLESRTRKGKRSHTWDGSNISTDSTSKETIESSDKTNPSVHANKFVWLHGQKLLLVTIPEGQYIVMKEFIASPLTGHDATEIYKKKTSELNINNKPLTHGCKNDVQKYLSTNSISCPSQIDIVSLSNAQKLLHHLNGVTSCDENCISMEPLSDPVHEPGADPAKKDRSASPDSTVLGDNQSSSASAASKTSKRGSCDGKYKYDLQQNKVSSQSLDDMDDTTQDEENDDALSSVSDATDLYCDGKPLPLENVSENGDGGGGGGVSKHRLRIEFDGGLAVFEKKDMPNRFLRFVNIRGNKCFLYQDLFRLFGQAEVIKIVINDTMRVKTCTVDEAKYLNKNQPHLVPVDPADNAFIHEKYVRKIFAYFGEPYPKVRLRINENLNDYKFPFKTHHEPPAKKLKQNERSANEVTSFEQHGDNRDRLTEIPGSTAIVGDSSPVKSAVSVGNKRKFAEASLSESCSEIPDDEDVLRKSRNENSYHLWEAEIAALKAELKEAKENNITLADKCKTFADELREAKSEWQEAIQKKSELEQKCRKHGEALSKLNAEVEAKDKENQILQKERDHYKDFVERITDTYKVADDPEEDMEM